MIGGALVIAEYMTEKEYLELVEVEYFTDLNQNDIRIGLALADLVQDLIRFKSDSHF